MEIMKRYIMEYMYVASQELLLRQWVNEKKIEQAPKKIFCKVASIYLYC